MTDGRFCSLCRVPIATGECRHITRADGQVVMSEAAWLALCDELASFRNPAGHTEDCDRENRWRENIGALPLCVCNRVAA